MTVACVHGQQQGISGMGGVGGIAGYQTNGQGPKLQITTKSLPNGTIGTAYTATVATKFGTAPLTFTITSGSLPNGLTLAASTGVISGTPGNNAGTFSFVVQVADSTSPTPQFALQSFSISILCTPLVLLTQSPLPPADQNVAYSFQMQAQGGIAPLAWAATGLPAGEGIVAGTGLITGTPTVTGTFTPQITVTDACPLTPQQQKGTFTHVVNATLAIAPGDPPKGTVGVPYTTQLNAVGGSTPYVWSLPSGTLPAGLSLAAATGVISGTPTNPQTTSAIVQVTDALAATASRSYNFTIACPALSITTTALPGGTQNQLYSLQMASSGGFGAVGWSATGLPAGVTISSSGLISGAPTANGTFTVVAAATDSCPNVQTTSQTYTLTIAAAIGPLAITSPTTMPTVNVGQPYNQQLQATGGVTPYVWSITNNAFPSGISLNSSGVVSGIATTAGTFTPTVQVADSGSQTTSAVFTLVTSCPAAPTISTAATLPVATQGLAYSVQLNASGGLTPYTWALIAGALPAGVTLSSGGLISGTPTATGTFNPQIKVTDACLPTGSTANTTFTLAVSANSGALTITSVSPIPAGTQGTPYSTTFTATGGTPPYTWSAPSAAHPGQVDMLDWAMMPLPDRTNFHMSGSAIKFFSLHGGVFFWLKGQTGNPWDGLSYDNSFIYDWFTENGDGGSQDTACQAAGFSSCFTDPFAFKMFVTPVSAMPRYFTLGGADVVLNHPSPNNFSRTTNCGADNQPLINLGNIIEVLHDGDYFAGTSTRAFGGSVGTVHTLERLHYWGLANMTYPPTSGHVEVFDMALGYGQIEWRSMHWNGSAYVVDQDSLNPNKVAGGPAAVNFGCKLPNVPSTTLTTGAPKTSGPSLDLIDSTGAFSGTPNKQGTTTFTVQVEDAVGAVATKTFSHTVNCSAISITSASPLPGGKTGQAYSFQFVSSGGISPVTWSATGVPSGLTLSTSGLLSGTPTTAATSTIAVTVTDGCSPTPDTAGPTNFSLTVTAPAPALTLVTTSPLPAATEGIAYSAQMAAQGGTPPYAWAKTAGTIPTGLALSTAGLLSGTPTSAGTQTPTIQVTDAAAVTASQAYSITVSCPAFAITTTSPLPSAKQSTAYSFQMASSGGFGAVTWSASGLPTGLTISAGGLITGTPSTNGTFTPSITATDSCSPTPQALSQTFTLQVNNNLAITTTSPLPQGTVNLAYNTTMSAAGGTPPYTWTVTAGSLPTGLSLSSAGVISGTPTVAATTTPTIKVTDSAAANVSAVFSITIVATSGADNRYCSPTGTWVGATTDGPAALPTQCMYTPLSATPSNGTVRGPDSTATTLQNDINAAACGDTILVQAGSVIQGPIVLKPKGCTTQWITIKSTGVSNGAFPAEGTRATPCIAGVASLPGRPAYICSNVGTNLTAQIFAVSSNNAITGPGADHYRLIGLELTRDQSAKKLIYAIVDLSGTSPLTNNIIFDRVWIHGVNATNFPQTAQTDTSTTRGIYLGQSNHVAVIDSYLSDFYDNGSTASNGNTDAQCVSGGAGGVQNTGWGVYKFVNNHCEGASEGLILGGSGGPALSPTGCTFGVNCNLDVPTDIEVRRNYFFAPMYWDGNTTTNNATGWPNRKNGIEFKTGARILLEANVMENCWYSSQPYCYVFDFAPKNQSNGAGTPICPSCLVQDFTARYNYGYKYPGIMIAIYSTMDIGCSTCSTLGRRGSVHDNLVGDNLNLDQLPLSGADGIEFLSDAGPMTQISIRHNTNLASVRSSVLWGSSTVGTGASGMNQITFQDNLMFSPNNANNGWHTFLPGNGTTSGTCDIVGMTLTTYLNTCINGTTPTWTVDHNAFFFPGTVSFTGWPAGNLTATSIATVGFTSVPANNSRGFPDSGFNPSIWQLLNTSPFHNAASDGTDIGANIQLLQSNIAGVREGPSSTVSHSATLTWSASATPGVTYNIYRSTTSGSGYAKIGSSPVGVLTYSDNTVSSGTTYFYVVTSFNGTTESAFSNQVSGTIP